MQNNLKNKPLSKFAQILFCNNLCLSDVVASKFNLHRISNPTVSIQVWFESQTTNEKFCIAAAVAAVVVVVVVVVAAVVVFVVVGVVADAADAAIVAIASAEMKLDLKWPGA